ncbi:hypothetical protein BST97_08415 [Nonlabens spongiae]|uniref:Uncharacterized protein n=1 Tax=Nonlabens spongiae TaxID=331648 RepID=A0A1W6MK91_9FLAO|nr:hypothetical protein [Nonlabens spongiae]ARN78021.1 hypothetical protein BST97_08415 [Nonlabens spongiae]
METLIYKNNIQINSGNGIHVQEIGGIKFVNFSNIPKLDDKISFIELSHEKGYIDYTKQWQLSLMVHDYHKRNDDIDHGDILTCLDENGQNHDFHLNNITPSYGYYTNFEFDTNSNSVKITRKPIGEIPKGSATIDNYFSDVFLAGMESIYGKQSLQFIAIAEDPDDSSSSKLLTIKISGNGSTGYYNLSYRPPYKGLSLI